MSEQSGKDTSRRGFLKGASRIATASALAAGLTPRVHAAGSDTIQVALVGCGGRGSGAAINALAVKNGPIKLVAMADVFEARLTSSYDSLIKAQAERKDPDTNEPVIGPDQIDVPEERKFIGFDAYKHAMDSLKPGDVVILATPPAFRWPHFKYAIDKELNVFMEKPVTVDGPTTRRILNLGELAGIRNLKVGVGLMCRHCDARKELFDRIQSGQIGDVEYLRAYRMHGPVGFFYSGPKPAEKTHLMYQVERFHSFLWASGGCYSDFYIHNIDECCWMKNGWPVKAQGMGWRHNRGDAIDQNFDGYSVEYSFEDGARLLLEGRCIEGCYNKFSSFAHGTKGSAVISISSHTPARSRILTGQDVHSETGVAWAYPEGEANPYQLEWNHLIQAIREDQPYNEVERGAMASLVTSMGRMAAHTGQEITLDQILNSDHEFAPDVDKFDGPDFEAPLQPDENGLYPLPNPGVKKDREY